MTLSLVNYAEKTKSNFFTFSQLNFIYFAVIATTTTTITLSSSSTAIKLTSDFCTIARCWPGWFSLIFLFNVLIAAFNIILMDGWLNGWLVGWMSIYLWISSVLCICLTFNPLILCMIVLLSPFPFPFPFPSPTQAGNIVHQLLATAAATSLAILGIYASAIYLSSLSSILCLLLFLLAGWFFS